MRTLRVVMMWWQICLDKAGDDPRQHAAPAGGVCSAACVFEDVRNLPPADDQLGEPNRTHVHPASGKRERRDTADQTDKKTQRERAREKESRRESYDTSMLLCCSSCLCYYMSDAPILSMTMDAAPLSLRIQSKFEFDKGHSFLIIAVFGSKFVSIRI